MKRSIVKPIIGGLLLGTFLFFTGPLILVVLLLKFIFTPFGLWRMRMMQGSYGGWHPGMRLAMAEKFRNMSEEEFNAFKEKMNHFSGYGCGPRGHWRRDDKQ